ncbi:SPOR domain-containing protein [uncultured Algibacter sp.]|uniref:SPOR domain-containing protein n=1 Tax=uncultured Algibacter sp. TaxID=298659 RepID=UPI002631F138|nr:SPOR domain-containing protein [uncultured Algibacter sp.]
MISTNFRTAIFTVICFSLVSTSIAAQEGQVTINQDKSISTLLELKKEMNKNENDSDRYKIQIYSGGRTQAKDAQNDFSKLFTDWKPTMQFEAPNFKIWAGNFRTRIEADRALKRIKKEFPSAFIFKPKKERS